MYISELNVGFVSKSDGCERDSFIDYCRTQDVFLVETCLRVFAVGRLDLSISPLKPVARQLNGEQAYSWLLKTASGLHSSVVGETEVFSQIKESWQNFESSDSRTASDLRLLMRKLFSDVKQIRSNYLQGIGGASYGSLARMLLNPEDGARVLLVGAGKLAESVIPYFSRHRLFVWNRSLERLQSLVAKLPKHRFEFSAQTDDFNLHAADAEYLIICTPVLPILEETWSKTMLDFGHRPVVLHLGTTANLLDHWSHVPTFMSLSHLFALQEQQDQLKKARVATAVEACDALANERYLMDAITINHGWEDLAGFS